MAGPDIAPLHSTTSLPPYTPAGSVAFAYTPSGGDANACMNDTGGPVSAATTGGANRMMSANASNDEGEPPRGTGTPIQLLTTSRPIRIATQEHPWCVLVPNPPTTPATAEKRILSDCRPAGCVTQGETPLPSRPLRNSLCMGCDKGEQHEQTKSRRTSSKQGWRNQRQARQHPCPHVAQDLRAGVLLPVIQKLPRLARCCFNSMRLRQANFAAITRLSTWSTRSLMHRNKDGGLSNWG